MGEIRILSNGAHQDIETGKIVAMKADSVQYRAMARARWDAAKEAAADGVLAGVNSSGVLPSPVDHPVAAWGAIVGRGAELLMNTDNARGYAELARFVGQAADMLPDKQQQDQPGSAVFTATIPLDQLAVMLDAVRQERERRTLDGQARDADTTDDNTPTTMDDDV